MRIRLALHHLPLTLITVAASIGAPACGDSSSNDHPIDAGSRPDSAYPTVDAPYTVDASPVPDASPIVDAAVDAARPPVDAAPLGQVTTFAQFNNTVAVGIAVSRTGRTFMAFSRAIDEHVPYSVAEMVNGAPHVFPAGLNQNTGVPAPDRLLSVQAVTVDALDRLWILDTSKVGQATIVPGTPKLIAVDLRTNQVVQTIFFPAAVAGANAMLNDVRIDLSKGAAGVAFVTDSSSPGPNGIVVVDLATGTAIRRLNDAPSTRPEPNLIITAEGQPLTIEQGAGAGTPLRVGSDGIALDADGHHLYYRALTGHHLYRVSSDALATPTTSDADVAATIEDLGDLGFASDGLLADAQGRLYLTDFEHNAIHRRNADGSIVLIAQDPQLLWTDSLALKPDGTLLITATQIERGPLLHGTDARVRPLTVWQIGTDSAQLTLGATP
jgi:sugar lactone lactonase YvrE